MKLVLIDWVDNSNLDSSWHDFEDIKAVGIPQKCRSVGWLLSDTKDCKTLIGSINEEHEVGFGDITILNCCITKIVVLREGKAKGK